MRDHIKKCKDTYHDLLEGSDAETGLHEPCFHKGDTHLSKEGIAPSTPFIYKLEEKRVNTKTIEELILEFHAEAEEEVTDVHNAHALHKRWNAPALDEDSKKSLYEADTDAEETPKKCMKSTAASTIPTMTKPPPSAAVGRAPKGTNIDEVKGLDEEELDYNDDVKIDDVGSGSSQTQEPPKDEKPQDSEKHSDQEHHSSGDRSTEHQGDDHSDHKKSQGRSGNKSRSKSPCGSCIPPPQSDRIHSGDRDCADDKSEDRDHRSDCGPYYSDDHDRYHHSYNRYHDDRYYDFNHSRYYDWGYNRRYDDRGRYWSSHRSPPHRSPNHSRPDDCHSDDLRDRHPWGDPRFRDR